MFLRAWIKLGEFLIAYGAIQLVGLCLRSLILKMRPKRDGTSKPTDRTD